MSHHPDAFAALVLLAIALAMFGPVLAQPGGLVYPPRGEFTDLTVTHWPNIEFAVQSLRANGQLPLWRPAIMSGTPFAANPLSGLHYVPHAIFLVVPLAIGFNVLFIAHVWLAGCGVYALLRAWQVQRLAAFVGALTWMATPKLFAHLGAGHVGMIEAVAWMPWAVLASHRLVEHRRAMDAIWLGAVWAIQFLADPRTSFYTLALTVAYLVAAVGFTTRIQSPEGGGRRSVLISLCLCVLVASVSFAMLSAALWLPLAEFIRLSNRGALALAEAGEWSLPLRQLVGVVLANWSGFHEWTVYVGILPLLLAVVGCQRRNAGRGGQNWLSPFLLLVLVLAALFSLGTNGPLFPLLFRLIPGLSFLRVPPRAWFIVALATACLCSFGVEAMMRPTSQPRGWVTLTGVALAACALMFGLGGFVVLLGHPEAASARASMLHMGLVAPASAAVLLLRTQGRIGARRFAVLSAGVIVATLLPVDWSFYRVVSEEWAFADHADVAAWLARNVQPRPFRVYSPSYSLPQHVAQRAGLELADGVDPMQVHTYASWMRVVTDASVRGYSVTIPPFPPGSDVRTALSHTTPDARLLGRLNVRYVVAEFPIWAEGLVEQARFGPTFVYENQFVLPRAYIGEGMPARIVINTPDRVVVEGDGPGTLTLIQINYPGWRATVDGHTVPIGVLPSVGTSSLLFELLLHLKLEEGHHLIEFVFDPWTVKVGVIVSGVGWGSLALGWVVGWLRRQWKRAAR